MLQRGLKQEANVDSLQSIIDNAIGSISKDVRIPKVKPVETIKHTDGTMMITLSDLHFDEVVRKEDVPNNEFNWEIAEARMAKYFQKAKEGHRGERRLVVACLSDFLTGVIHNAQENASRPIIQAVDLLALTLSNHIADISTLFKEVDIYTVEANHERLTEKTASFAKGFDFSYVLYKILEARLSLYTNIKFNISTSGYNVIPIGKKLLGIHHGDRVRESISVSRTLKVKEIFKQTLGVTIDHILQGHLHSLAIAQHGDCIHIVSPSFIGPASYSQASGFLGTPPAQLVMFWDSEGTLDSIRNIDLSN